MADTTGFLGGLLGGVGSAVGGLVCVPTASTTLAPGSALGTTTPVTTAQVSSTTPTPALSLPGFSSQSPLSISLGDTSLTSVLFTTTSTSSSDTHRGTSTEPTTLLTSTDPSAVPTSLVLASGTPSPVASPSSPSAAAPSVEAHTTQTSGRTSGTMAMALAISIPIVVLSLAGIGFLLWRRRRGADGVSKPVDDEEIESWRQMNLANREKFSPARNY